MVGVDNQRRDLFHFIIIKPSHYDDDGYPIQWFRSRHRAAAGQ